MIQIMVYHNNSEKMQFICKAVSAYFEKVRHAYNISAFTKMENAMKCLKNQGEKLDIVFLDCSELAKAATLVRRLREKSMKTSWVYVDGDVNGLCRILLMRPSAYLGDCSQLKQVLSVIQRLDEYHQDLQRKSEFSFKCEREYIRIPYEDINYFESNAKKVTLHLGRSEKCYYFSAKLDDIESMLPEHFLRCHQSYLVNMQKIRMLDENRHVFVLRSNEEVLISRRNYVAARSAYQQFVAETG